jgi:hypothetical protein
MEPRHAEKTESRDWFERLHLIWPMLFLIGWVLYELTTQPMVGAVAVCLKFGWEDFRAAIWLRQRDPWRLRGRACFWLYLALGLWKIAVVAFLMSISFVIISPKGPGAAQGQRLAAIMEVTVWTGYATFFGLVSALLALGYSLLLGWWGGLKLWVSNDVHAARRRNVWPPLMGVSKRRSELWTMVIAGMLLLGLMLILSGLFMGGFVLLFLLQPWMAEEVLIPICGIFILIWWMLNVVGGSVSIRYCLEHIHLLLARWPSECWGEAPGQSAETESMAYPSSNPIN